MLSKQQISHKMFILGWIVIVVLPPRCEIERIMDCTWNTLILPADECIEIFLFHLKTHTIIKLHLMSEKCCLIIIIIIERCLLWHT